MNNSELLPANILLNSQQLVYALGIFGFPDSIPTKNILSVNFQIRDGNAQPKNLFEYNLIWSTNQQIRTYRQHLAQQVLVIFSVDLAEGRKPILTIPARLFPGKICIKEKCKTIEIAKKAKS